MITFKVIIIMISPCCVTISEKFKSHSIHANALPNKIGYLHKHCVMEIIIIPSLFIAWPQNPSVPIIRESDTVRAGFFLYYRWEMQRNITGEGYIFHKYLLYKIISLRVTLNLFQIWQKILVHVTILF